MAQERVRRRLAAILAADVAGYSRLMERDEAGTLAALKSRRKNILQPLLARHSGRIIKLMGDGVLVEFASAVDAVQCAVELQNEMAAANADVSQDSWIVLRVGINLGDVVVEGSDLYGDGVNIAARLEALAEPGSIIVSRTVFNHVRGKVKLGFDDLGEQHLKNIAEPVRIYRLRRHVEGAVARPVLAVPDKPSIAVLPFTNMSSDPEQEYFVDGLAEDLITDLSKVPGLFVISRHSAFAYRGKTIDIRSVAKDLGVRFVVEGSVRRAAMRIRITAQLIDAEDGTHRWADRFDRDLADVFLLQDEVVGRIVSALAGLLPSARPISSQRAANLEAYELFARGRVLVTQSIEGNREARRLLERSIELDPGFADAHAWLAMSHLWDWSYWAEPMEPHRSLALATAQHAVSLNPDNTGAHAILGYILAQEGRTDPGTMELMTALQMNPNHADAWAFLGATKAHEESAVEGIEDLRKAFRLNPHPPGWYYWHLGFVHYTAGQYEEAVETLRHEATHRSGSQRILAASLAQLDRMEEAKLEAAQFLAVQPHFSTQRWVDTQPFLRDVDRQRFIDGYLKAGLPK